MKSNGQEQMIHISEQSFQELKKTDSFQIKYRGEVNLKGRGDMKCYWLTGLKKARVLPEYRASVQSGPVRKKTERVTLADVDVRASVASSIGAISNNSYGARAPQNLAKGSR